MDPELTSARRESCSAAVFPGPVPDAQSGLACVPPHDAVAAFGAEQYCGVEQVFEMDTFFNVDS